MGLNLLLAKAHMRQKPLVEQKPLLGQKPSQWAYLYIGQKTLVGQNYMLGKGPSCPMPHKVFKGFYWLDIKYELAKTKLGRQWREKLQVR